jgi:hypothetical protein
MDLENTGKLCFPELAEKFQAESINPGASGNSGGGGSAFPVKE